jgi:hypothetical protein
MSIKLFKKSATHISQSDLEAKAKFKCQCGEEIELEIHEQEEICKCGIKYRIACHVEMEVDQDVDYEQQLLICEKCTVPISNCPDPEYPKKLVWVSGDIEPVNSE